MAKKIRLREKDILDLSILTPIQKEIIIAYFLKEERIASIAKRLNKHYNTVCYHKKEAITKLYKRYKD